MAHFTYANFRNYTQLLEEVFDIFFCQILPKKIFFKCYVFKTGHADARNILIMDYQLTVFRSWP